MTKPNSKCRTAADIDEAISRGEPCPCCGQPWIDAPWVGRGARELAHRADCAWYRRPDSVPFGRLFPVCDEVAEYLAGYVTSDDLSPAAREEVGEVD